jgi:hypothetical protein
MDQFAIVKDELSSGEMVTAWRELRSMCLVVSSLIGLIRGVLPCSKVICPKGNRTSIKGAKASVEGEKAPKPKVSTNH